MPGEAAWPAVRGWELRVYKSERPGLEREGKLREKKMKRERGKPKFANKLLLEGLVVVSFLLVESRRDNWWPVRGTDSPTEFRTFSSQWLPAG